MPHPSTLCGWATPETALWPFQEWLAGRGGPPAGQAAFFYPLGHPTPYAYAFDTFSTHCVVIFARLLRAFVFSLWAFALALVVDVAGGLAGGVRRTFGVALVHHVDNFGVGESECVAVTRGPGIPDRELVVLVSLVDFRSGGRHMDSH
jgi:hypothetical protein